MFGLPQETSEEERKQHEEQTQTIVRNATCAAVLLWASPVVWHFIRKQWQ